MEQISLSPRLIIFRGRGCDFFPSLEKRIYFIFSRLEPMCKKKAQSAKCVRECVSERDK